MLLHIYRSWSCSFALAALLVAGSSCAEPLTNFDSVLAAALVPPALNAPATRALPALAAPQLQSPIPLGNISAANPNPRALGSCTGAGVASSANALPVIAPLPAITRPLLCGGNRSAQDAGSPQNVPARSADIGAPCPAEAFDRTPDQCFAQAGEDTALHHQQNWLWFTGVRSLHDVPGLALSIGRAR